MRTFRRTDFPPSARVIRLLLLAIVAFAALICAVMMLWWFLIGRHNQAQR